MNDLSATYPIWWNIKTIKYEPGNRENMPIPAQNTIRIFGILPREFTINEILKETNVDFDNQAYIDLVIPHPYTQCTLITSNADGEKTYDISLQTPLSLTNNSNADAMNLIS